jgi:hypothetical protein
MVFCASGERGEQCGHYVGVCGCVFIPCLNLFVFESARERPKIKHKCVGVTVSEGGWVNQPP